ncbi:MAG: hypothetical protein V4611_04280 [Patescibacteria group bacterium]
MADTNDDASVNLLRAIVQNVSGPQVDWDNWESMSILVESFQGRFNSVSGSLYSPDGTISIVAARPSAVLPFVDAYISSKYKPGEKLPVCFLVQYSRKSGKYTITFEDTDEKRWKITPKNYKELREELRPTFE